MHIPEKLVRYSIHGGNVNFSVDQIERQPAAHKSFVALLAAGIRGRQDQTDAQAPAEGSGECVSCGWVLRGYEWSDCCMENMIDGETPVLITGTESDNPFAIDIGVFCGQITDIADVVSLKTFANTEFCPRFISDESDLTDIGRKLTGATVVVVSTASNSLSRNELSLAKHAGCPRGERQRRAEGGAG